MHSWYKINQSNEYLEMNQWSCKLCWTSQLTLKNVWIRQSFITTEFYRWYPNIKKVFKNFFFNYSLIYNVSSFIFLFKSRQWRKQENSDFVSNQTIENTQEIIYFAYVDYFPLDYFGKSYFNPIILVTKKKINTCIRHMRSLLALTRKRLSKKNRRDSSTAARSSAVPASGSNSHVCRPRKLLVLNK